MPPGAEDLAVEHRGQLLFHVQSQSKEEAFYVVDMEENKGIGRCTCRDWETRCSPRIRDGLPYHDYPHAERLTCKHVNAVILWIGKEAIRRTLQ